MAGPMYAGETATPERREGELASLCNQLEDAVNSLNGLNERLIKLGSAILDPRPTNVNNAKDGGTPPDSSTIQGRLRSIQRRLLGALNMAHENVSEIERAV